MSFNLLGYNPESPSDGGFEPIKYNGTATVEKSMISTNTKRDTEFYPKGCTMIEIEAVCMQDNAFKTKEGAVMQTIGRTLRKRFNLDSDKADGKGKTSVMKLADQFFPLNLEFKDMDSLKEANEKFVGMDIVVKAWPADFNDGRGPQQMWNIKGIANNKPTGQPAVAGKPSF